jgi:hypothetical protein
MAKIASVILKPMDLDTMENLLDCMRTPPSPDFR